MKRALSLGRNLIAILVGTVALVAICAWIWPELVLNARNLRWVLDRTKFRDQIQWQGLNLRFVSRGWAGKQVNVESQGFRFRDGHGTNLAIDTAQLSFTFRLGFRGLQINRIDLLEGRIGALELGPQLFSGQSPAKQTKGRNADYALSLRVPELQSLVGNYLPMRKLGKVDIQIDHVAYSNLSAQASIRTPNFLSTEAQRLEIDLRAQSSTLNLSTALSLKAMDARVDTTMELNGSGAFDARLAGERWRGTLNLAWGERLRFDSEFQVQRGRERSAPAKLRVEQNADRLLAQLKGRRPSWLKLPLALETIDCTFSAKLAAETGEPEQVDLACPFTYRLAKHAFVSQPSRRAFLGNLYWNAGLRRSGKQIRLEASELNLSTEGNELILDGQMSGRLDADLKQKQFANAALDSLQVKLRIPEFAWLVQSLDRTIWPVPAPFRTLNGSIDAEISAQPYETELLMGGKADLNLRGGRQVVQIRSSAEARLPSSRLEEIAPRFQENPLAVDVDVNLQDLALELPYLDLQTPPRMFPDRRFLTQNEPPPAKPSPILLNLRIATGERPVRLYSNLLPDPIAVHLDYRLPSRGSLEGKIWLEPLNADIFRRKIRVDRLALKTDGKGEANPTSIDGLFTYTTSDVGVRIFVLGPVSAPRLQFESDPPLTRDQIISVLVFNSSLDELSEDKQRSATNIGQALSSGALSLTAMYLLAATPVESVQFDPVSQSYSARLRLGQKTTFSLGTAAASDFQTYGIGRRLGKQLSLQTELRRDPAHQTSSVATMLRWFLRY